MSTINKILFSLLILVCFQGTSQLSAQPIRAAFDVGSGQTKVTIAEVDETTGRPIRVLFSDETAILLGHDFKQSKEGRLSDEILSKLEEVLTHYRTIAIELDAEDLAGVATAVFRESKNGAEFIKKIRDEKGINLQLISQEEEGRIGFLTAMAASGKQANEIIAWDSGGASFQITTAVDEKLFMYEGPWGASKAVAALIEIQGKDFSKVQNPNPTKLEDVIALNDRIKKSLHEASFELETQLNNLDVNVIAIGGPYSPFKITALATGTNVYTKKQVANAIKNLVGSSNEELAKQFPEPEMVIPRLTLVYAVMDHFGMDEVHYIATVGSTLGVFISPQFWRVPQKMQLQ